MEELLCTWEPNPLYSEAKRKVSFTVGFGSGPLVLTVSATSFVLQILVTNSEPPLSRLRSQTASSLLNSAPPALAHLV